MVICHRLQSRRNAVATLLGGVATAIFGVLGITLHGVFAADLSAAETNCRVIAKAVLPSQMLVDEDPATEGDRAVRLGGLSDLVVLPSAEGGLTFEIRLITDRGPTSKRKTPQGKRRVMQNPAFVPTLLTFAIRSARNVEPGAGPVELHAECISAEPFRSRSGKPVTGRPNGLPGDEVAYQPPGEVALPADPNGIDSEGLAMLRDGSYWLTEEYLPSILRVSAEGVVLARYVPEGIVLPEADTEIVANLPARYRHRQANRGFEAVAISPDELTLWALLQSPLESKESTSATASGLVRLLEFDARESRPIAEYLYRLGDPTSPGFDRGEATPDDGKLCAMVAIDAASLLVIEQSDDGEAKLYRCGLSAATNTLHDPRWHE